MSWAPPARTHGGIEPRLAMTPNARACPSPPDGFDGLGDFGAQREQLDTAALPSPGDGGTLPEVGRARLCWGRCGHGPCLLDTSLLLGCHGCMREPVHAGQGGERGPVPGRRHVHPTAPLRRRRGRHIAGSGDRRQGQCGESREHRRAEPCKVTGRLGRGRSGELVEPLHPVRLPAPGACLGRVAGSGARCGRNGGSVDEGGLVHVAVDIGPAIGQTGWAIGTHRGRPPGWDRQARPTPGTDGSKAPTGVDPRRLAGSSPGSDASGVRPPGRQ